VIIEDTPADDWVNRGPDLVGYIDTFSPDVLCVQEAPLSAVEYLKEHLASANFQYTGFGRFDGVHGDEHNAIFFDSDQFTFVDGDTFWLSDFPDYPSTTWFNFFLRMCTWAVLEKKTDGTRFCVFNTHFDFWEYFQTRAAKLIKERMDRHAGGLPVFLTGDFNMGNTTEAFQLLKNHGNKDLLDSYTGPITTSSCFDFTVDPSDTSGRIDFILVSSGVTVNNCTVPQDTRSNGRTYSDHYPVVLNCTI
jgi:endonuclease/exonuclease/phosphatase family metal-dependent hydrolase